MAEQPAKRIDKGTALELRIARMLYAEGYTPFVNVFFKNVNEPASMSMPDVDVMGVRMMPDVSIIYSHYDCKSGASSVVYRILMLLGLRDSLPAGSITYIRDRAPLDLKLYALNNSIRLGSIAQINEREQRYIAPLLGDDFPFVADHNCHALWMDLSRLGRGKRIGQIARYFVMEYWSEKHFTRLRRTIAALSQTSAACHEAGIVGTNGDLIIAYVLRYFLFALLDASTRLQYFTTDEMEAAVSDWLVNERIPIKEFNDLITNTAEMTYHIYGDKNKGPLHQELYMVTPPNYTTSLLQLLQRTLALEESLEFILPCFDALLVEVGVLDRRHIADVLLRKIQTHEIAAVKKWMRTVRVFLLEIQPNIKEWPGWDAILDNGINASAISKDQNGN